MNMPGVLVRSKFALHESHELSVGGLGSGLEHDEGLGFGEAIGIKQGLLCAVVQYLGLAPEVGHSFKNAGELFAVHHAAHSKAVAALVPGDEPL